MNGPEHYREAERLLQGSVDYYNGGQSRVDRRPTPEQVAEAQVHATLALAAATALPAATIYYGDESTAVRAWAGVVES